MGRGYEDSGGASTGVSKRWCLGSGGSSAQAPGLCVADFAGYEPGMAWVRWHWWLGLGGMSELCRGS